MTPRYMPIEKFVVWSGIGRTTVYRLLSGGELKAIKLGRRTLIDVPAAEQWMNSLPSHTINMGGHRAPAA